MPDAPFSNIDPWTRSPRDATTGRPGDEELRNLTAELRRLRLELRAVRDTVKDGVDRPA